MYIGAQFLVSAIRTVGGESVWVVISRQPEASVMLLIDMPFVLDIWLPYLVSMCGDVQSMPCS